MHSMHGWPAIWWLFDYGRRPQLGAIDLCPGAPSPAEATCRFFTLSADVGKWCPRRPRAWGLLSGGLPPDLLLQLTSRVSVGALDVFQPQTLSSDLLHSWALQNSGHGRAARRPGGSISGKACAQEDPRLLHRSSFWRPKALSCLCSCTPCPAVHACIHHYRTSFLLFQIPPPSPPTHPTSPSPSPSLPPVRNHGFTGWSSTEPASGRAGKHEIRFGSSWRPIFTPQSRHSSPRACRWCWCGAGVVLVLLSACWPLPLFGGAGHDKQNFPPHRSDSLQTGYGENVGGKGGDGSGRRL